ncbi:hypothetical protein VZ94_21120 [Methylocucumis oryzae]|uniref:Uncharacterized protein n=2 Tax=Methylocucumis oryzae TaxID=1632867 RepID=A0A0F3IHT3_9GAMM|nr:hypothetical protein VZ94_21120 [Methylocucumis oryzae]
MNKLDVLLVAICGSALITNAVILYSPKLEIAPATVATLETNTNTSSHEHQLLAEIKRLQSSLTAMDDRLIRMEGLLAANTGTRVTEPAKTEAKAATQKLSYAEIQQKNQALRQVANTKLSDSFASEEADKKWAANTIQLIQDKLAQSEKLAQVNIVNVDCKASLCRLEALVEEPSQLIGLEEELPFLLANELPRTQIFNEQQPDGSNRIEIFLARKGYKL